MCIPPVPSHLPLLVGDGLSPLVGWEEQSRVPVVACVVCQLDIFLVAVVEKPIFVWNQSTIPESYIGGRRLLPVSNYSPVWIRAA